MSGKLPYMILQRVIKDENGTYGRLQSGALHCWTVEPPDLGNMPWHSCIPAGLYLVTHGTYNKGDGGEGYPCLVVNDVPGRTDIKIHVFNDPDDSDGCIGPNEALINVTGKIEGVNSRPVLKSLLRSVEGTEVWLLILDP